MASLRRARPALAVLLVAFAASCALRVERPSPPPASPSTWVPVGQTVSPSGLQVELPGMRPQVLALSPDGRRLVTSGTTREVVVVDPASGAIRERAPFPANAPEAPPGESSSSNILSPETEGQASYTGSIFSPDGRRLYLSNVEGSIEVFDAGPGQDLKGLFSIPLPASGAPRRVRDIPAGLAVSPDGRRLYAALNLSNRLGEFDATDGRLLRLFDAGVAPFDVALVRTKAYVSNWGGGRPGPGDAVGPAGQGTTVRIDPSTGAAAEGSVTIIDLSSGTTIAEVRTGRHASALAVHPGGRYVVCANAADDTLSVIDTRTDRVVETIWAKPSPADLFGASPNALAFDRTGRTLYVANGTQNAVAVIDFRPARRGSRLRGLIPVGWFPGALVLHHGLGKLCVANIKGVEAVEGTDERTGHPGFNSHRYHGSLSLIPLPRDADLPRLTAAVWAGMHKERIAQAFLPPRPGAPAVPVPERVGEPSVHKHVVYIIKENRTYDQVLGDVARGNGDPDLCVFGEEVTPNQHKLVSEFVLLDNTYCCGVLSADGHQWSTTAFGTDYLERSFANWPRSYPDGMGKDEVDALAYAPTGFIWDNVLRHGRTLRDYGEFAIPIVRWADPSRKGAPDWTACWKETLAPTGAIVFASEPGVEALRPHLAERTVGWSMEVPDQFRANVILRELAEFEKRGTFPDLVLVCLPDDHTSGTSEGSPTPEACAADNDLAFGRIVEALSRSRFWPEMVVFGIEDDPQNGWDHVSAYRTTAYVAGPYVKRGAVVSTRYNTISILRTIEQILGCPPMNQFDAAAEPMFDCFTATPDLGAFVAMPNRIPLDRMNPPASALADPVLRKDAAVSGKLDFTRVDACPEDVLNGILWRARKGSRVPYPEGTASRVADDDD